MNYKSIIYVVKTKGNCCNNLFNKDFMCHECHYYKSECISSLSGFDGDSSIRLRYTRALKDLQKLSEEDLFDNII